MKTITIITEQITEQALAAALPADGIASVTVTRGRAARPASAVRSFRNPNRFSPDYRIELVVDDDAVESVFDGIDVAYGAGLFSDAEAWVGEATTAAAA